nr:hypothetical protein [Pseudomonas sp.]
MRRLLASGGARPATGETPFISWVALPDLALPAINHHRINGRDLRHCIVFERSAGQMHEPDSASYLPRNVPTGFTAMQPKWFIAVDRASA